MGSTELARVESEAVHDFAQVMKVDDLLAPPSSAGQRPRTDRLNLDVNDTNPLRKISPCHRVCVAS